MAVTSDTNVPSSLQPGKADDAFFVGYFPMFGLDN
jgi:hypothetical protein